jgi:hypothetical protein
MMNCGRNWLECQFVQLTSHVNCYGICLVHSCWDRNQIKKTVQAVCLKLTDFLKGSEEKKSMGAVCQKLGTATRYGLDGPGIEFRWRLFAHAQTGPGAHLSSYTMGSGYFPGKKRPGRGVDHPPLFSAKVKERV